MICNRVGLPKGSLDYLFRYVANGEYDSITIDRTVGTPHFIRKNLYEPIDEDRMEQEMKKLRVNELRQIRDEAKMSKD